MRIELFYHNFFNSNDGCQMTVDSSGYELVATFGWGENASFSDGTRRRTGGELMATIWQKGGAV